MILHDFLDYLGKDFPDLEGAENQVIIIDEFQKYAQNEKREQRNAEYLRNTYGEENAARAEAILENRDWS